MSLSPVNRLLQLTNVRFQSIRTLAKEATFPTKPFKTYRFDEMPASSVTLTREQAVKIYRDMATIRRMEAGANALYREKSIRGFCHLYTGQEAVCVGMQYPLKPNDAVITSYRMHGWTYIRGIPPKTILSELTGRRTGPSRGKGGSMHMYNREFFGGNGIVGAQVPLGAGVAWAKKYKGDDGVCIALYGDGAANQGQLFETYNMCELWNIPGIFVCENNGYGMGTPVSRHSANTDFYTRGEHVKGLWLDGMDVASVIAGTKFLVDNCRKGKGPYLLEVATYRYHGHSMSDPGTSYRSREEVQEMRHSHDCITNFKEQIIGADLTTPEELKQIDSEIKKEIDEAVKYSQQDPEVGLEELYADVYMDPLEHEIRGITPFTKHYHKRIVTPFNQ